MITVTKQSNSVLFEFENNPHYLQQGTMEVPFNSLILVEDESDMLTFKKASTNDILFSAMFTEFSSLGNTKDAVVSALEDMMFAEGGGGGGVDPEDVVEIVESALTDYWTSAQTQSAINAATSGTPSSQVIEQLRTDVNTISGDVTNKYDKVSGITIELNEEDNPFIKIEKELEDGSTNYTDINDTGLNSAFENNEDGGVYNSYIGQGSLGNSATDFPDENVTSERNLNISTDGFEQNIYENYDDGETQYLRYSSENTFNYADGLILHQYWYDPEEDTETNSYINVVNNNSGETYIELTDTNERKVTLNPLSVSWDDGNDSGEFEWSSIATLNDIQEYSAGTGIDITDNVISATGGGGVSSAEVETMISEAVSGKADSSAVTQSLTSKQDTLISGTNIKTINNESLLGSGNITISGGGTVDQSLDSGSTNPVENRVIVDALSHYITGGTCGDDYGNELVDLNEQDIDLQRMRDNLTDKIANETLNTWWDASEQTTAATITHNASLGFEIPEWDIEAEEWRNNGTVEFFDMSAEFDMDGNDDVTGVTITPIDRTITLDGFGITQLADYQPLLSAGTGIDITNNVISATGGGGGGSYQYYTEDTTGNTATIHIENTDNGTTGEVFVYDDGTQMTGTRNDNDEGIEYSTNINLAPESIDITYEKGTSDETTDAHSYLYVNENNISLEVMSNEVTTTLEVNDNGVSINNDRVVTEAAFQYDPITSALTITFLNA